MVVSKSSTSPREGGACYRIVYGDLQLTTWGGSLVVVCLDGLSVYLLHQERGVSEPGRPPVPC